MPQARTEASSGNPVEPAAGSAPEVRGGDAVRTALLSAAAECLASTGPRALSVREVARRAGVNHGQVHHYFGGKRGLLEAAMRKLAVEHFAFATERSAGRAIPPLPEVLVEDPLYWRAVCQCVMDGDLDLARIEVDEDVSVPRRTIRALVERYGVADDMDFKARVAAVMALHLGWVAMEEFLFIITDVREEDRDALRERMKRLVAGWTGTLPKR